MNHTCSIKEIQVEYQKMPLGLDCSHPHFLWKVTREEPGYMQSAYQILVGTAPGEADLWDSRKVDSGDSAGVRYKGEPLKPCTRYYVTVKVWDEKGEAAATGETWFETGLMDPSLVSWEGAKWIGAPERYLRSETMGVFVLKTRFSIAQGGGCAGLVFGADDARLMDPRKNQYQIEGENYIRYEIDVSVLPAKLRIFRAGYHPEDRADRPLACVEISPSLITEDNRYQEHVLRVEVTGNCAYAFLDDTRIDAVEQETFFGKTVEGRQLNPLGSNDITTFPRLCSIGYYAGPSAQVWFSGIEISYLREPGALAAAVDPEGIRLDGGAEGRQVVKDPSRHSLPMFRRLFHTENRPVCSARLYITARGIYDCRINGQEVTDSILNPGASQYDRHLMVQTYDVTGLIRDGENGIGVVLASGWWSDAQTFVVRNYNYYGDQESFLAKLVIQYADGSRSVVVSEPDSWEYYGEGPYLYSGLFQGERVDGRQMEAYENLSLPGGPVPGTVDSRILRPVILTPPHIAATRTMPEGFGREWPEIDHSRTRLTGGLNSPVTEVCRIRAKSRVQSREGLYIYDLGQEIAGVPSITFHGKRGEKAVIRFAEMLYPDLPEYQGLSGLLLTENYRDAESIDTYILRGDTEGEVCQPRFTFHGFRYIEITGVEHAPQPEEVEGVQISSVPVITGSLKTSDALLNRFIENVRWSQLCNFISIPTDCPQRNERMGWAGDTHVFCRTATYQADTRIFYYRYLQALADLQREDGQLPEIAPCGGGFGGITYECAMIFIVWELYQQYGDTDVIREYFGCMEKWLSYIRGQGMPGMAWVGPINDWLAPEKTDDHLIWNAFYCRSADLLARMAKVIGAEESEAWLSQEARKAKQYWNEQFVDPRTGRIRDSSGELMNTQCAFALPLVYEILDEKYRKQAGEDLARHTQETGYTVQTGFFGTGLLNTALSQSGHKDTAFRLMLQTEFPSWLYPVTQGATTIWERWNSYTKENGFGGNNAMNSFNHYSLGSVLSWIYETVLGIRRDEARPGYRHFYLCPDMQALSSAGGGFESPYGRIESRWEKTENGYRYSCTVPCNTTATLFLKTGEKRIEKELGSGTWEFQV